MSRTNDRLRFGWLADQRLAWTALLDAARTVERLGYDSIWMSDHFRDEQDRWLLDAWTAAGAVLASVPRVETGLLVASNSLRPPMVTAHMTSTLHDIGQGRFVLGLGVGGSREEHLAAGVGFAPFKERAAALTAACDMIRSTALDRGPGTGARPASEEETSQVPLVIGGRGEEILRIAGRYADRWTIWGSPERLAAADEHLSRYEREAGREPRSVRRGAIVMLLPEHLPERSDPSPWPAELRGGRSAVVEQLARYAEAGVGDIIVCDYGLQPAVRPTALEWFADVVDSFQKSVQ